MSWRILVGASAGAIAGFAIGGIGGRLAMLLLRLTSPPSVIGMISDDGFEIGVVTYHTLNLVLGMTMVGETVGVLYAACRSALPAHQRRVVWGVLCSLVGGSFFVHDEGVDFFLLEPQLLAVVLFVALPGSAGVLMASLAERWSSMTPWQGRKPVIGLLLAAAVGTFAVPFGIVAGAIVLAISIALERLGRAGTIVRRAGTVAILLALTALGAVTAIDLVRKSISILS